jgi:hypothetical protein
MLWLTLSCHPPSPPWRCLRVLTANLLLALGDLEYNWVSVHTSAGIGKLLKSNERVRTEWPNHAAAE